MPTIISTIQDYWADNTTLNNALDSSKVYTLAVPSSFVDAFPYAVLTPIDSSPQPLTGNSFVEKFTFQIKYYSDDPDDADETGVTIQRQFDYKLVAGAATVSCERVSGPILDYDQTTPTLLYMTLLTYELRVNKTLGTNGQPFSDGFSAGFEYIFS